MKKNQPSNTSPYPSMERCLRAGMPRQLVNFVSKLPLGDAFVPMHERMDRLVKYYENNPAKEAEFHKAWRSLDRLVISADLIIDLFANLPDASDELPLLLLPMNRPIDVEEEARRINVLLASVNKIEEFCSWQNPIKKPHNSHPQDLRKAYPKDATEKTIPLARRTAISKEIKRSVTVPSSLKLLWLSVDADATSPKATAAYKEFESVQMEFIDALKKFKNLLKLVDPAAKIPTKHWKAPDANHKIYAGRVSSLNHYLAKPCHVALATIANANNPNDPLSEDSVRKAWKRTAAKNPYF